MTRDEARPRPRFVSPVRARNLLWIGVIAAAVVAWYQVGTPHLRVSYRWHGNVDDPVYEACHYWGLHPFNVVPADGNCPLIVFVRARRKGAA